MTLAPTHHYTQHLPALDGLRGYAAVVVTFYHAVLLDTSLLNRVLIPPLHAIPAQDLSAKAALAVCNGGAAVIVFYVLSGLVLHQSLSRETTLNLRTLMLFLMRRAFRLFPVMVACMAGFWVASRLFRDLAGLQTYPDVTWQGALENGLFIDTSIHGASKSVQTDLFATPFIILFAWLTRRWGVGAGLILSALAVVAMEFPALVFHWDNMAPTLLAFFLGTLLTLPELRSLFSETGDVFAVLALVGAFAARHFVRLELMSGLIAQIVFAALLVGAIRYGDPQSRFQRFLKAPVSQTLGRISYSYYVWNVLFVWIIAYTPLGTAWTPLLQEWPALRGLMIGIVLVMATLPLAFLSQKYLERPFIHLGRSWTKRFQPESAHG